MFAKKLVIAAVLLLCSLKAFGSPAPSYQQGVKLVGTGAVGAADQGSSVSLSADGNTAIVGGYFDNSQAGAAWVYTRSGGVWSQQGAKLVGTSAAGTADQGYSVALSADGNTAIVGGPGDNGLVGAAWVWTRNAGVWSQQGAKLVGLGTVGAPRQGLSVSLSADGNTAIVGGWGDNGGAGAAWVFTRTGSAWAQQGAKLVGSGAVGPAEQGYSVSLSADGNTAVVGGPADNGSGAAWVYTRSAGVWSQQGLKLVGTGAVGGAGQGVSVSLSADGNSAIVGGLGDNGNLGAAWVYTRSGGVWSQQGSKLVGIGAVGTAEQGWSVALSADGNSAIVGGYGDNSGAGAAWVYTRSGGVWSQQGAKRVGTGVVGSAQQGWSVSLSGDGLTAIMGGDNDNSNAGAAWVLIDPAPAIASVRDVPNDQGGKVKLSWNASVLDAYSDPNLSAYDILRSVPPNLAAGARGGRAVPLGTGVPLPGELIETRFGVQTYYWELLTSVSPLHYVSGYSYIAPTTGDSIAGSNPYTYFMVVARNTSDALFWPSAPDSGYSVDNLPPGAPAIIASAYQTGATHLHWGPNSEPDFSLYRIYRGSSSGFVPGTGNMIASQPDTGYADTGPAGSYYKLSAVDIHGNESGFSLFSPAANTGVPSGGTVAFALEGVWPNPARANGLHVAFALASDAAARLELLDMSGRRVVAQDVGALGAGRHTVNLAEGHKVAPGLYWVRLTQGTNHRVTRAAVLE